MTIQEAMPVKQFEEFLAEIDRKSADDLARLYGEDNSHHHLIEYFSVIVRNAPEDFQLGLLVAVCLFARALEINELAAMEQSGIECNMPDAPRSPHVRASDIECDIEGCNKLASFIQNRKAYCVDHRK